MAIPIEYMPYHSGVARFDLLQPDAHSLPQKKWIIEKAKRYTLVKNDKNYSFTIKMVDRAGFEPAYGKPGRFTVCCL
jgi:hypothetical protein